MSAAVSLAVEEQVADTLRPSGFLLEAQRFTLADTRVPPGAYFTVGALLRGGEPEHRIRKAVETEREELNGRLEMLCADYRDGDCTLADLAEAVATLTDFDNAWPEAVIR